MIKYLLVIAVALALCPDCRDMYAAADVDEITASESDVMSEESSSDDEPDDAISESDDISIGEDSE
jgi:hypothetical protein